LIDPEYENEEEEVAEAKPAGQLIDLFYSIFHYLLLHFFLFAPSSPIRPSAYCNSNWNSISIRRRAKKQQFVEGAARTHTHISEGARTHAHI